MIIVIGFGSFGKKVVNFIKNKEPITIIDKDIEDTVDKIVDNLKEQYGATLR